MSFFDKIVSATIQPSLQQAEDTATTIAYAVAVWGVIITAELGLLIYLTWSERK